MKFIKTQDGEFFRAEAIDCLGIDDEGGFHRRFRVTCNLGTIAAFDTAAEAEKYLEELITRLETE